MPAELYSLMGKEVEVVVKYGDGTKSIIGVLVYNGTQFITLKTNEGLVWVNTEYIITISLRTGE